MTFSLTDHTKQYLSPTLIYVYLQQKNIKERNMTMKTDDDVLKMLSVDI